MALSSSSEIREANYALDAAEDLAAIRALDQAPSPSPVPASTPAPASATAAYSSTLAAADPNADARQRVTLKLLDVAPAAVATLTREMLNAEKSSDRQRAANSILDRAGFGRNVKVQVSDAKALLYRRLMEIREQTLQLPEQAAGETSASATDLPASPVSPQVMLHRQVSEQIEIQGDL